MNSPDYFAIAAAQARDHAELTMRDAVIDKCVASMKAARKHRERVEAERSLDEINREALRDFDATEAAAINRNR